MSNSFDWNNFNKIFQQFFPQGTNMGLGPKIDLSWVNKHIEETLKQAMPQSSPRKSAPPSYAYDMVEIHNYVIVKLTMSESEARNVRLSASSSQLKIYSDSSRKQQIIPLPALIEPESSKAIYKNNILEIRLLKHETAERFSQLNIRFI